MKEFHVLGNSNNTNPVGISQARENNSSSSSSSRVKLLPETSLAPTLIPFWTRHRDCTLLTQQMNMCEVYV